VNEVAAPLGSTDGNVESVGGEQKVDTSWEVFGG